MKCLQARAYIQLFDSGQKRQAALMHARQCSHCQPRVAPDLVLERMLDLRASGDNAPGTDFYQRLRMRIDRELAFQTSPRSVLTTTWEGVVLQLQGWVYAGSLAAVVILGLLIYTGGFTQYSPSGRDRLGEEMISQGNEALSQDEVLFALLSEEN